MLLVERDGRIALANPFARAQLGAVATLSPQGHVTAIGDLSLSQLLAAPGIAPVEVGAGGGRVFQVATQRLDAAQGVVVVIRDVTREREVQKAAGLQARLAAVGQLAAGIAHDFNNILMTIVNSAELAQRRYSDATFVHARLDLIVEQGERAAALVRQILDFSRQSPPSLQPLDLAGLVQETIELLAAHAAGHDRHRARRRSGIVPGQRRFEPAAAGPDQPRRSTRAMRCRSAARCGSTCRAAARTAPASPVSRRRPSGW